MRNIWIFMILDMMVALALPDELKLVIALVRHGARTPIKPIPELAKRIAWPVTLEDLTPIGQRQLYLLGRMLRKKYIEDEKFLPAVYNASLVQVRSTQFRRTIMSDQSLVTGLYTGGLEKLTPEQLSQEQIWVPPINLTFSSLVKTSLKDSALPFDMHAFPILNYALNSERLLFFSSCPKYSFVRGSYYKTDKFSEVYKQYNETFQEVCNLIGVNCVNVKGSDTFFYVDNIVSAEFHDKLPELSPQKDLVYEMLRFYTDLMLGELVMDPVMNTICTNGMSIEFPKYFENAINGQGPKINLFETHDSSILGWLNAFGIPRKGIYEVIPYASNIIFELRKDANGEYYVNMIYNDKILMGHVPMKEFVEKIKALGKLEVKWDEWCKIPETQDSSTGISEHNWSIWWILSAVFVAVIGIVAAIIAKLKSGKTESAIPQVNNESSISISILSQQ